MAAVRRLLLGALATALAATGPTAGGPPAAHADPLADAEVAVRRAQDLVAQARELAQTAQDVRDLLYYLSDPRGFQYDLYATSAEIQADPVLGPLVRNLASLYKQRVWTATARAQAMADSATPASAAVGASLTWDMPLCRMIDLQGSGQVFHEDGEPAAALAYGVGGCLPLPFGTFELGYRGRRAVRTSLLTVPIIDGARQSGDTVYSSLRFYRWLSRRHQIDVMPMSFNFDWAEGDGTTSMQAYVTVSPVHWARRGRGYRGRDQTYDFMRIAFTTLGLYDGIADPLVATLSPLAIDGVRIGSHVALGLDLGWSDLEACRADELLPTLRRRMLHLDATIVTGVERATLEVHLKKAKQPTLANQLLDEDRLTARLDANRRAAWLRVDGFVSHARLIGVERYSRKVWTYGAGAELTLALDRHLYGYVRGEAARGLVVDERAPIPDTALDLRGTLGVTTQLQKRW